MAVCRATGLIAVGGLGVVPADDGRTPAPPAIVVLRINADVQHYECVLSTAGRHLGPAHAPAQGVALRLAAQRVYGLMAGAAADPYQVVTKVAFSPGGGGRLAVLQYGGTVTAFDGPAFAHRIVVRSGPSPAPAPTPRSTAPRTKPAWTPSSPASMPLRK